ncbi:fructose-6-phosphate aldolase [Paraclostridium bifermentans]|uniref:Probable transaldolase n=1 Tax=Paraclostridium bifermentans TaxID=1490 RepID=A0AA44DLF2_PARBF|nr:fructose-6-phosphate aldolase [Paraclostridium bifermentans]MBN8047551.1 fructose-6-phosphate aldolase [Paraclostridium bifermentans]MCU9808938.1 fructose-6-phosphate aldolase [Paraclostridium sp. AKS46]NME09845.1 fructose-6-phosphate aldolase [Paraclostridium bifermentans]
MKIFIDTANVEEIKEAATWGILDGVTTNPSLIAKEGRDIKEVINEICEIVDGPISAEVISLESDKMVEEALDLVKLHKNIVIKLPMCIEGLKAVKILSEKNIKTNVTLIFSSQQALLAAKAGATYVSPFVGRLDDIGVTGVDLISDIANIFEVHSINTEIISASIRNPIHVSECAMAGSNIATIPFNVLKQMAKHPLTDIGIEKFLSDYKNML